MKILMMNHFPLSGSGSGVYTLEMAKSLTGFGHKVCIIYPENRPSTIKADGSMELRPIWFKNDLLDPETMTGVECLPFNFPCFTSHPRSHNTYSTLSDEEISLYASALKISLQEAVKDFEPDVLHIQHAWVGAGLAADLGIPYIITCHGTDQMGFEQDSRYRAMALKGIWGAHRVIAISNQVYDHALACYEPKGGARSSEKGLENCLRQKMIKIHNGYCPITFNSKPRQSPQWMKAEKEKNPQIQWVTFTGKLTEFKGVDLLIKAAVEYEAKNPWIHTLISGDGVLRQPLEELVKDLDLKNIHFLGHQHADDLVAIYQQAAVHVVPSRTEPFGLVAIEALACGLPVVGTAAGGLLEIVKPSVGRLVPLEDSHALGNAILHFVEINANRDLSTCCSAYAESHFGWERTARSVEALYLGAATVLSPADLANTTA